MNPTSQIPNNDPAKAFRDRLAPLHLTPLWEALDHLVPQAPRSGMTSALWRYDEVRRKLMEAGELISAEEAVRRVLILENPAAPGQSRISDTLYAGLQLLLPGETAPCHRHSQCALRFVMEGTGAYTALDGRRVYMHPWDLVLTPNWVWHEHGNPVEQPVIWLDGLDIPLVGLLNTGFAESMEGPHQPGPDYERSADGVSQRYRKFDSRPVAAAESGTYIYPYSEWREQLDLSAREVGPDCRHAHLIEFANPANSGPVMPTISAFAQWFPGGFATQPIRRTDSMVFVVVEGSGEMTIANHAFELQVGDVLVVPCWTPYSTRAGDSLVLFSYSDKATQQALGFWRLTTELA